MEDAAIGLGGFGIGWNEQTRENQETAKNLSKYYDGREIEAYQQRGQLMYIKEARVVKHVCIEWYLEAVGDRGHKFGKLYSEDENNE